MSENKTADEAKNKTATAPAAGESMCIVRALKTPVSVPGAKLAKGGQCRCDVKTAKLKAELGEVEIIKAL